MGGIQKSSNALFQTIKLFVKSILFDQRWQNLNVTIELQAKKRLLVGNAGRD
jgi:hypothetical protein